MRAIKAAGQAVRGVRFHQDGGFTVVVGPPEPGSDVTTANEWDEVLHDVKD
jgi:hypothetical protein